MSTEGSFDNIDRKTVADFGDEWVAFDQIALRDEDHLEHFDRYFHIFPFDALPSDAEGFDLGCGSGRWASEVAKRVGLLHCIDPSEKALEVARRRMADRSDVKFHLASVDCIPLEESSQDFGYAIGVLHHVPDTARALRDCVRKVKVGAPFLLYVYYALDGRPAWFRGIWKLSDVARRRISLLSFRRKKLVAELIAAMVYWPLARTASLFEKLGADVFHWPLSAYRHGTFYRMRTDALDRFGTRLEQRFTRDEIARMMTNAGLGDLRFSAREPFWVACGLRMQ
jgi:ubiquinone/menaquinone biosynthesis C-methylase UbiE